jgi:nitrite reductase/ring-hydroxylating ferredoxin subunit
MRYVTLANTSDLAPGTMKEVKAETNRLLLANVDGNFYAISQKCPHLGGNLCKGTLSGSIVTCPWHKAGFDVKTGQAIDPAKVLFLTMKTKNVASYPIKVENGQVLVGL